MFEYQNNKHNISTQKNKLTNCVSFPQHCRINTHLQDKLSY